MIPTECKNVAYRIKMRFPLQSTEAIVNFLNDMMTVFTHTDQPADRKRTAVTKPLATVVSSK